MELVSSNLDKHMAPFVKNVACLIKDGNYALFILDTFRFSS